MQIHKCDQLSDEWFELRKGKMTASNAQAIGANGRGLETYIYTLMAEKYSNNKEHYTNKDMERGIELEEQARMTYEIENEKVEQVGFIELDEFTGCSPDGLVGEDGGLEIKCVNDVNFFKLLINRERDLDIKHIWQCQMCLYITKRKWWDLSIYNPNFDRNLLVFRIEPDETKFLKLQAGIMSGENKIKELLNFKI